MLRNLLRKIKPLAYTTKCLKQRYIKIFNSSDIPNIYICNILATPTCAPDSPLTLFSFEFKHKLLKSCSILAVTISTFVTKCKQCFSLQSFKSDADEEEEEVVADVTKKTAAMKMAEKEAAAAAAVEVS